jgi:hypothetical protein
MGHRFGAVAGQKGQKVEEQLGIYCIEQRISMAWSHGVSTADAWCDGRCDGRAQGVEMFAILVTTMVGMSRSLPWFMSRRWVDGIRWRQLLEQVQQITLRVWRTRLCSWLTVGHVVDASGFKWCAYVWGQGSHPLGVATAIANEVDWADHFIPLLGFVIFLNKHDCVHDFNAQARGSLSILKKIYGRRGYIIYKYYLQKWMLFLLPTSWRRYESPSYIRGTMKFEDRWISH